MLHSDIGEATLSNPSEAAFSDIVEGILSHATLSDSGEITVSNPSAAELPDTTKAKS